MANMKISEIITVLDAILRDVGDVDVIGECEDCTTTDMNVYILTDEKEKGKCWIQVATK